jgi:hypothetical protein
VLLVCVQLAIHFGILTPPLARINTFVDVDVDSQGGITHGLEPLFHMDCLRAGAFKLNIRVQILEVIPYHVVISYDHHMSYACLHHVVRLVHHIQYITRAIAVYMKQVMRILGAHFISPYAFVDLYHHR